MHAVCFLGGGTIRLYAYVRVSTMGDPARQTATRPTTERPTQHHQATGRRSHYTYSYLRV